MAWSDLFVGLGLAAVIEGVLYAIAPNATKEAFAQFFALPSEARRLIGVAIALGGLVIVSLARN